MGMIDVRQKELFAGETKCCVDCKTTKTPLWRGGPAGPKSLCNACGIRFRKRRMSTTGTNRGFDRKRERGGAHNNVSTTVSATTSSSGTTAATTTTTGGDGEEEEDLGEYGSLRMRLMMALREEMMAVQNLPLTVKKQQCQRRRKLGNGDEEEQAAAVSLMALSCGSVFG